MNALKNKWLSKINAEYYMHERLRKRMNHMEQMVVTLLNFQKVLKYSKGGGAR